MAGFLAQGQYDPKLTYINNNYIDLWLEFLDKRI